MQPQSTAWLPIFLFSLSSAAYGGDCGSQPGDLAAVADARTQVEATCHCATAASRAVYRSCARAVLTLRRTQGLLSSTCATSVRRCVTRSTCGRPGSTACCRTGAAGAKCQLSRSAAACTQSGGTPKACPSCCDACTDACLGSACGHAAFPDCGGDCPAGSSCALDSIPTWFQGHCACYPDAITPCGESPFPACGGACLDGNTCQAIDYRELPGNSGFSLCACVPPGSACASGPQPCSAPGRCPAGQACQLSSGPPDYQLFCAGCAVPTTTTTASSTTTTTTSPDGSCGGSAFPACGGSCGAGQSCYPGRLVVDGTPLLAVCGCRATGAICSGATIESCTPPGECPSGQVCTYRTTSAPATQTCGCEPQ